ncbi:MAG TPA: hypothetical protein VGX69_08520 [Solirubrobacteraceae bacterium]|jgi:hypothetical protein|nr:hypothetical protein [Solirubrobacteraceae bacterium]
MLALLLAVALIGLTILALLLAGAAIAVVTGVLVLNACLLVLALRRRPARDRSGARELPEPWRPSSFRRPPEPPGESDPAPADSQSTPTLRVHRL